MVASRTDTYFLRSGSRVLRTLSASREKPFFLGRRRDAGHVSYESGVEVSKRVLTTTFRDTFSESEGAVIEIVGIAEKMSETHRAAPHEDGFPEDGKTADLDR